MISKYQVIRALNNYKQDKNTEILLSEDDKNILDVDGNVLCTVDEYYQFLRRKLHCDFEVILDMHGTLDVVYQCKECGTVIFASDDEYSYEPDLCCPHCSGYKTRFTYWTKEEIDTDPDKQAEVQAYIEMQDYMNKAEERAKKRGKRDWEIWVKVFKSKKKQVKYSLECCNLFSTKLKGLNLHISTNYKNENGMYCESKNRRIPLSPYAAYIQWIVPRKMAVKTMK